MAQKKILLDSNSYFRLAKDVHPLLFTEFGEEKYCLYVLTELEDEWSKNSRLKSKFSWIMDDQYINNRTRKITVSNKQEKKINTTFDFIWGTVQEFYPGPSEIDTLYLAYASVLIIPVTTDDQDMSLAAKEFDIEAISTLELLALMVENDHIKFQKVRQITEYWKYDDDMPANFSRDYKKHFGK